MEEERHRDNEVTQYVRMKACSTVSTAAEKKKKKKKEKRKKKDTPLGRKEVVGDLQRSHFSGVVTKKVTRRSWAGQEF